MATAESIYQRIAHDVPLDPEVGFHIHDAELTRYALGDVFLYAQAVESEYRSSRSVAHALAPNMDPLLADLLEAQEPQELRHGEIEGNSLLVMGLQPGESVRKVSLPLQIAGKLSGISPAFHDIAETTIAVYAGLGEREVTIAYPKAAGLARSIGENALAADALLPMDRQESNHLAFYEAFVRERWEQLKPWQQQMVRRIIETIYYPVGVQRGSPERMKGFGKLLLAVEPDEPMAPAVKVEKLAAKILHTSYQERGFLQKRYQECLDELVA